MKMIKPPAETKEVQLVDRVKVRDLYEFHK